MELDDVLNETNEVKTEEVLEKNVSLKQQHREKEKSARDAGVKQEEVKEDTKKEKETKKEPEQEFTAREKAAFAKAQDEVSKRQARERENEQLRAELAALKVNQPKPDPTEEAQKFFTDPVGQFNTLKNEIAQEFNQKFAQQKLAIGEQYARQIHKDYDEKAVVFGELLKTIPGLYQRWVSAPDMADFAYKTAKAHTAAEQFGDPDEMRSMIEKEVRIKLEEEFKKKQESQAKERELIPDSLSGVSSKSGKHVYTGPTSLDDILK